MLLLKLDLKIDETEILSVKQELFGIPVRDIDPNNIALSTLRLVPTETSKIYSFLKTLLDN